MSWMTGIRFPAEATIFLSVIRAVGIATRYVLDVPRIDSRWRSQISRTRPDRPWGPLSLVHNGHRVSVPGVKRSGREDDHPPASSAKVKENIELHL